MSKQIKTFFEGDLNFTEINKSLKKEKPVKLTIQEIVSRLKDGLQTAIENGVTHQRLVTILKDDYEIEMSEATLKKYLSEGKPGSRINKDNAEKAASNLNNN